MAKKTISIGGLKLDYNQGNKDYLPSSQTIIGCQSELKTLAYAIKTNKPVLLIGETGVGKTALIRYLASKTNNAFRRVNLNGQTSVDEFVGKTLLNKEGTYWIDGILTESLRKGYWLLLDEINSALPEVLFVLHSLLDDDRYIVLSENKGEIVRPHPNFRLFCSMNPSGKYAGTKELNKAFLSRFPIIIKLGFPTGTIETKIIENYAKIKKSEIKNLVKMAQDLRKSYRKDEIEFICSTRDLINTAIIAKETGNLKNALNLAILGRCQDEDFKAVSTVVGLYFGTDDIPQRVKDYEKEIKEIRKKLETQQGEIQELIGDVYYEIGNTQDHINTFQEKIKLSKGKKKTKDSLNYNLELISDHTKRAMKKLKAGDKKFQ